MGSLDHVVDLGEVVDSLLVVHAHPDDETITTGATMSGLAADGVPVTLVTCTRGELGEVIGDELAHLEGDGPALAAHREGELAAAMQALGVSDHRFLGAAQGVLFSDSGMVWGPDGLATTPPDVSPNAFAVADLDTVAGYLAGVIDEVKPSHLVTYEAGGGYGHPDHVQAHRVSVRALELASHDAQLLYVVTPQSVDDAGLAAVASAGLVGRPAGDSRPSMVLLDDQVVYRYEGDPFFKAEGLRQHPTQVVVSDDERFFALSNFVWQPLSGTEYFATA